MFSLLLVLSSFLAPLRAFQLYHRILHPSLPDQSFFHRGTIQHGKARIEAAPSLQYDLLAFAETSAHVTDALYQLALDPHPGQSDSLWLISTVKAVTIPFSPPSPLLLFSSPPPPFFLQCHLINPTNERIVIHLPSPGGTPFALDYFLDSVPSDGACPPSRVSSPTLASPRNATIIFSLPGQPPLPELRTPPPLTATGDPVTQVPEKTFLQKYWLYIVIALGALLIAPSGEEGAGAS
ncbi:hypothetical protein EDB92DRAFT_1940932 [Lactarius akahatsu]|uniref:ER membrane protein complex subunit 10 n=1 Tax=Lactarius akahatsu TaxID=416441 RepID=A0AAD4LQU3_9AGAM|nr:hypothetical protein EDB92DRAFT_1940932 [Lactarius akahatsu]